MLSGRLQGFIPQKMAHFEEHILTLHTVRSQGLQVLSDPIGLQVALFVRFRPDHGAKSRSHAIVTQREARKSIGNR
jgi:hypothetical protein